MRYVGIHYDVDGISVVVVEQRDGEIVIVATASDAGIREVWQRYRLANCPGAAALCSRGMLFRHLVVEFTDEKLIRQIARYRVEPYIHNHDIEDLCVDFHILTKQNMESELLVAAVENVVLHQTLEDLENYDIRPFVLDIDVLGLYYLIKFSKSEDAVYLDCRRDSCCVLCLSHGRIKHIRNIMITESQRWLKDLHILLLGHGIGQNIYILGDKNNAVSELLQTTLKLPVQSLDIRNYFDIDNEVLPENISPIALGMALKAMSKSNEGFNFRQGTFAYKNSLEIYKRPLLVALLLFCLVLWGVAGMVYSKAQSSYATFRELEQTCYALQKRIQGSAPENVDIAMRLRQVQSISDPEKEIDEELEILPRWAQMMEIFQEVDRRYEVQMEKMELDDQSAVFVGWIENDIAFDLWKKRARDLEWISDNDSALHLRSKRLEKPRENLRYSYHYTVYFPEVK